MRHPGPLRPKTEKAKLAEKSEKLAALARSGKPKELPAIDVESLINDLRSLRTLLGGTRRPLGSPSCGSSRASF